jgi:hypothetical protein
MDKGSSQWTGDACTMADRGAPGQPGNVSGDRMGVRKGLSVNTAAGKLPGGRRVLTRS